MDDMLQRRYECLFLSYGSGASSSLVDVKHRLRSLYYDGFLRADAALFLLVNADHMLYRPYFGYVPDETANPIAAPQLVERDRREPDALITALDQILGALEGDRPHSAHDVMQAIDRRWKDLSLLMGWL